MAHRADHLAAHLAHHIAGVLFQRLAEGVVGGQEEPVSGTGLHHCPTGTVGQREGVVGVMDPVRRTFLVGQRGRTGAVVDDDALLLRAELLHADADRRVQQVDDHVHALGVEPFARLGHADIGLVLVVGRHDLDRLAEHLAAEIVDRHLHGRDRALATDGRVHAGHVGQHADLDAVGVGLRLAGNGTEGGQQRELVLSSHLGVSPGYGMGCLHAEIAVQQLGLFAELVTTHAFRHPAVFDHVVAIGQ
ncbi:MAG: hypothetical protein PBU43_06095 [Microvirgula aerodenitrificans]